MTYRHAQDTQRRWDRLGWAAIIFAAVGAAWAASGLNEPPKALPESSLPAEAAAVPSFGVVSIDYGDDGSVDAEVRVRVEPAVVPSMGRAESPAAAPSESARLEARG